MTAHLRPARSTDAGRVGAILSAFIDDTAWMPRIHTRAEDVAHAGQMIDRGWVMVAEMDGQVRGFLARDGAVIHALYVDRKAQRQKLGAELMQAAMRAAPRLELWTFEANRGAQRFYERHGFVCAETTDGVGNDEGLPDRRYVWTRPDPDTAPRPAKEAAT